MDASLADTEGVLDGAGEGTPRLTLDGFSGPLETLLTLARAQKIDLATISLAALVDQLGMALRQAPASLPLGQKGDWVVMTAWLVQLRSLLLLPANAPAQQDAAAEADHLLGRLVALEDIHALVGWLERRPQLGHDVFARGRPEVLGLSIEVAPALDVVEFLWASLALFDDDAAEPDTATVYRPTHFDLYAVAEARDRILRRLAETPQGVRFEHLLPDADAVSEQTQRSGLRRRSAWSSTFIASLELARQGDVVLGQGGDFEPIHVARV